MTNMNRSASRKRVLARGMTRYWPRFECLEDRITPAELHWLGDSGSSGHLWNVPANWQENLVPVNGDILVFDTTTAGFTATANSFSPNNNIPGLSNLTIAINDASSAGDFSLSGNAISLAAAGVASNVSSGAGATLTTNFTMPATTTFAGAGAPLTVAGSLSGAGGLTIANSGTVILQGVNAYQGPTFVGSGTLRAAQPPNLPNAVAHYGLDGNVNNVSSNSGLNATINGTGTSYVAGRFGQALNVTGTQSARVAYNAAFALNTFTVSAWVKLNIGPGNFGVVGTRVGGDNTFGFKVSTATIRGEVGNGTSWLSTTINIDQVVPTGSWHMITYAFDNAAQRATLYYDGIQRATYTFAGTPLLMKAGETMTFGLDGSGEFMNGTLDEVNIFSKALSAVEVAALYLTNTIPVAIPIASPVTVAAGATLDLAGNSITIGSLSGAGTVTSSVAGAATLTTGADNSSSNFSGTIQDGDGVVALTKIGTGTLTLSGINAYSGPTTVSSGQLFSAPHLSSANSATFQVGRPNTFVATATSAPAAAFSHTGALPAGVTMSPSGVLSGTPSIDAVGIYPLTVFADNGIGAPASQSFTLTVVQLAPAITSSNTVMFPENQASTFTIAATGAPIPTFTLAGVLPTGVSLTTQGVLSGTPVAGSAGVYPLTVYAANGVGETASQPLTLLVSRPPAFTSANAATFTVGQTNNFLISGTGPPAPTFTKSGILPSGVSLNLDGTLSGTPATGSGGIYIVTLTANNGTATSATQNFTLTANETPAITSAAAATFLLNQVAGFTVASLGFPAPTFSVTGALPTGISFSAGGVFSGTPTVGATGVYPLVITAANGIGAVATQSFTLTVGTPTAITSADAATFVFGQAGTFAVTITGSPTPTVSFTGTLPAGITFAGGVFSGTPTGASGVYPLVITASNGINNAVTQNFTLTVNRTPTFTSAASVTYAIGALRNFPLTADAYPAAAFTVTGTLPSGMGVSGNQIFGNPTVGTTGTYTFTLTANNGIGTPATQTFTLTVVNSLFSSATVAAWSSPRFLASADFRSLGRSDLAVTNYNTGTVSTYLNNGSGTLTALPGIATANGTQGIATGDFNADGHPDIAFAVYPSGSVHIHLGAGDGTFASAQTRLTGGQPVFVLAADVNMDGKLDLLTADSGSTVSSLFLGVGDGTFLPRTSIVTGNTPAKSLAVADFFGDGKPSLVAIGGAPNFVNILHANGDGTFDHPITYVVGNEPIAVKAGDLDGDGRIDIAFSNLNSGVVMTMRNLGGGSFDAPVTLGPGNQGIDLADFNGDGMLDIAAAHTGDQYVYLYPNRGDGTFEVPYRVSAGNGPFGLISRDFNGDGKPDLAVTNRNSNNVSILLNTFAWFNQPPFFTGPPQGSLTIGTTSSFQVIANSVLPITYSQTGSLPSGVTFSASGQFSGTPAAGTAGTYPIVISATNGIGAPATQRVRSP